MNHKVQALHRTGSATLEAILAGSRKQSISFLSLVCETPTGGRGSIQAGRPIQHRQYFVVRSKRTLVFANERL